MSESNPAPAEETSAPALVVFGLDDGGKAHASWFEADEIELVTKAASLMAMHTLSVTADDHRALAASLPRGRVFASGRAFVPFAKRAVYERLCVMAGLPADAPRPKPTKPEPPDDSPIDEQEIEEAVAFDTARLPSWSDVQVGGVVLATDGPTQGWYEALVGEVKDDLYVLCWRDFVGEPSFVRRREHLILYPMTVEPA